MNMSTLKRQICCLFLVFNQIPDEEGDKRDGMRYCAKCIFSRPRSKMSQLH